MPKIENGAVLAKALADSKTGEAKLAFIESFMRERFLSTKVIPTADECIQALESHPLADQWEGTIRKAKNFAKFGCADAPEDATPKRIWDTLVESPPTEADFTAAKAAEVAAVGAIGPACNVDDVMDRIRHSKDEASVRATLAAALAGEPLPDIDDTDLEDQGLTGDGEGIDQPDTLKL